MNPDKVKFDSFNNGYNSVVSYLFSTKIESNTSFPPLFLRRL